MYALCVICYNERHPSHPERSFHRFPKNEEMKSKWIEAIGSHCHSTSGMICSDHFLPEDFCEPVGYGYVPKRLLQDNAIPKLKIIGLSMTDIRLQQDNIKEDVEQRVVVHSLDSSGKENMHCMTQDVENSMIKFKQCSEALSCVDENTTLNCKNENLSLSCGNENITLSCNNDYIPLNYGYENIPLNFGNENIPLNFDVENIPLNFDIDSTPLNCDYENVSLNCGNKNIPLKDDNENITDPDLKRIISGNGNINIIDLSQEDNDTAAEFNSTSQKKEDILETKLKRVVIKMPDIGLRSFTEDDFTSTLAWKIFVKFILHNRKETRSLKHKSVRLQQKVESYQKMFEILRKGGRIRIESKS